MGYSTDSGKKVFSHLIRAAARVICVASAVNFVTGGIDHLATWSIRNDGMQKVRLAREYLTCCLLILLMLLPDNCNNYRCTKCHSRCMIPLIYALLTYCLENQICTTRLERCWLWPRTAQWLNFNMARKCQTALSTPRSVCFNLTLFPLTAGRLVLSVYLRYSFTCISNIHIMPLYAAGSSRNWNRNGWGKRHSCHWESRKGEAS